MVCFPFFFLGQFLGCKQDCFSCSALMFHVFILMQHVASSHLLCGASLKKLRVTFVDIDLHCVTLWFSSFQWNIQATYDAG